MKCDNYINGICVLNRESCRYISVGDGCPSCNASRMPFATFRQLAELYCNVSTCNHKRKKLAVMVARRMAEVIGRSYDDEADLSENDYDIIFRRLRDGENEYSTDGFGGKFELSTIANWFAVWKMMCGRGSGETASVVRKTLKLRGIRSPHTDDIPTFKIPKKPIRELSDEEIQQIEDRIVILRHSSRKRDRLIGLWLDIEAETGARPSDIMTATWSWFRQDPDRGWIFSFVPHKTEKKTNGRPVIGRLSRGFVARIREIIGNQEDPIFPTDSRYSRGIKNGEYAGKSYYLNSLANMEIRKIIGKESKMAQYLLRRLKSKRMIENEGMIAEAQALGHSPKIAFNHYTKFENLQMKPKIRY